MSAYDLEQEANCRTGQERETLLAAAKIMRDIEHRRDIERALEELSWFDGMKIGERQAIVDTVLACKIRYEK